MDLAVEEGDYWWFVELYATLGAFADKPTNTISRIGSGRISIPEDHANHLANFRHCILAKYPNAEDLQVMRIAAEIDAILNQKSRGGESFEEEFWTNKGFISHPEWAKIRSIARAFLAR